MDRFRLMQTFVQVAHAGSFTSVASQIGPSRAMISRHISELEDHLGLRLFNRLTRAVVLIEAGRGYLAICENLSPAISRRPASCTSSWQS